MNFLKNVAESRRAVSQLCRLLIKGTSTHYVSVAHASFLSEAYYCKTDWDKRLESSLMKKIDIDNLFFEIDKKYQTDSVISAIDVDLFVNKINDVDNIDEIEELAHRLRKSPATADTLPSTSHAVIRCFMNAGATDGLLRILNDRMNYGIFLDFYSANLLMNEFIVKENYRDAAKIAALLMLEEDFSHRTSKFFSLLSCLKYIYTPSTEPWDPNAPPPDTSKEETKFRVPFLRNPYFDYHFDMTEPHLIIGKTLSEISQYLNEDEVLRRSVELLGSAYLDRWDNVLSLLKKAIDTKSAISEDGLRKVSELIETKLDEIATSPTKSLPHPKLTQFPGVNLDENIINSFWSTMRIPDFKSILPEIKTLLATNTVTRSSNYDLISKTEELLAKVIAEREQVEVQEQQKTYQEWEEMRMNELKRQLERFKKDEIIRNIAQKKEDLKTKEETIFFFDNEEEWMMKQPPGALDAYILPTEYVPTNWEKFVKTFPEKKLKRKKKSKV